MMPRTKMGSGRGSISCEKAMFVSEFIAFGDRAEEYSEEYLRLC